MPSSALLLVLLALVPRGAHALWKEGWQLSGSVCMGNALPTCADQCTSWTQSTNSACVQGATGSILSGKWSTLTVDTDTTGTLTLFSDAACTVPDPANCTKVGALLDDSCSYMAMCNPAVTSVTQDSYRFQLAKPLPGYVIALIIFFGGVVPLLLVVLCCYCCCCRGSAKTASDDLEAQRAAESRGAYTREQMREMEYAQRQQPRRAPY